MANDKKKKKQFETSLGKERAKQTMIEKRLSQIAGRKEPELKGVIKYIAKFMDAVTPEITEKKRVKKFGEAFERMYKRRGKASYEKKGGVIKKKKGGKVK